MVGRPMLRAEEKIESRELKDIHIGDDCVSLRHTLQVSYPIDNGIIRNWDDMIHVWEYTFTHKLNINPKECKILLTEPPLNPKENRENMIRIMFERFGFQAVYVQTQAVLTLYAQGLVTGVVVDIGDGVTHIVPVYENYVLKHLTKRLNVAGRHITYYLIKLMQLRGYIFNRTADFETVRMMKEKLCYVSYDLDFDKKLALETTALVKPYITSDGRTVKLGRERFEAAEALFRPQVIDMEGPGIAEAIFNCIQSADIDTRPKLYQHIVLSGGSSMYPGLPSRLEKEVRLLHTQKILGGDESKAAKFKIRIDDPPRRKHMVFLGGAVLGDLMKDRPDFWVTREDFEEGGVELAMKKLNL
mmetsp:Transcript_34742/g.56269  ORF Transcript_34742/g.56269 Transcript_34742/m.56269 type:complete len:358 (+) Transcript_34742:244-1317(+)